MYWVVKRSGLFNREYYLRNNLDVARSCVNPIMHYIRHGWCEGRNPSPLFDTNWYLQQNPDVAKAGINPLYHYIKHGWKERRKPSPEFNNEFHSDPMSDLNNSKLKPFVHFILHGQHKKRNCSPFKSMAKYIKNKPLLDNTSLKTKRLTKGLINNGALSVNVSKDYNTGLISIIIPVYNTERYLHRLLDSIMHQTYNYIQVAIVDDGSFKKKKIQDIAKEYKNKLNLSFYQLEKNCGANYARNYGFSKSCGEFVFFCDSDVILSHDILEKMLQCLHEASSASWVYCNYLSGNRKLRFHPFDAKKLYCFNFCSTMSLIKRESFPGFDETIKRYQDWDLFLTIYENGGTGIWIDEFLFYTEDRHDGITNSNLTTDFQARRILKKKYKKIWIPAK